MTEEPTTSPTTGADPEIRKSRRWNIVWFVPLVALVLGAWLLYHNFAAQGPVARVRFDTADGVMAGKTEVRCRSVKVGVVKQVKLAEDLKSVLMHLELDPDAEGLLRQGTFFWVVKPRFKATEISGVDTLISGAYVELDPGPPTAEKCYDFTGSEDTPATNRNVPGLRLTLTADEAGFLSVGSPMYYRGFEVGRIESRTLEADGKKVSYRAFVRKEYSQVVTENTRFWNTSGLDISAGSEGFKVRTPSFQAMVSGGVSFGVTNGDDPGKVVPDESTFTLYPDQDAALKATFHPNTRFLLLFDQSVRGLAEKAPVEFRGITIGRVAEISFDLVPTGGDSRIPVLIELDTSKMRPEAASKVQDPDSDFVKMAVSHGLRAALKTGNLLTGSMYVDLDYYPEAQVAEVGKSGDFTTLPTVSSGFVQLEAKLTAILDKIQALPIDKTMGDFAAAAQEAKTTIAESRKTLREIEDTAAAARKVIDGPGFRGLPDDLHKTLDKLQTLAASVGPDGAIQGDLLRTLDELRASLRAIKSATSTIDEKPNSLLFGRDSTGNPKPKAPHGDH